MSLCFFQNTNCPLFNRAPICRAHESQNNTKSLHHLSDGARFVVFLSVERRFKFIERAHISLNLFLKIRTTRPFSEPLFDDPNDRKIIQSPAVHHLSDGARICVCLSVKRRFKVIERAHICFYLFFKKFKPLAFLPSPHLSIQQSQNNTRPLHHISDWARIGVFLSLKCSFKIVETLHISRYLFLRIQTTGLLPSPLLTIPTIAK